MLIFFVNLSITEQKCALAYQKNNLIPCRRMLYTSRSSQYVSKARKKSIDYIKLLLFYFLAYNFCTNSQIYILKFICNTISSVIAICFNICKWVLNKLPFVPWPARRGVLRRVSNSPVKICCTYFGHIYIFSEYYSYFVI